MAMKFVQQSEHKVCKNKTKAKYCDTTVQMYCKTINIRGALIFVDFGGKQNHKFKISKKHMFKIDLYKVMKNAKM